MSFLAKLHRNRPLAAVCGGSGLLLFGYFVTLLHCQEPNRTAVQSKSAPPRSVEHAHQPLTNFFRSTDPQSLRIPPQELPPEPPNAAPLTPANAQTHVQEGKFWGAAAASQARPNAVPPKIIAPAAPIISTQFTAPVQQASHSHVGNLHSSNPHSINSHSRNPRTTDPRLQNPHGANFHAKQASSAQLGGEQVLPAEMMPPHHRAAASDLLKQTQEQANAKSFGCVQCHQNVGDMHAKPTVKLGCVDCHGGDPTATTLECAHVFPALPKAWPGSANPVRSYTLLNYESPEFIRFVNPGDLRVAHVACGGCHEKEVLHVKKSMMTHGAMLWSAALYNNGAVPAKRALFGESYSPLGAPQRIQTIPPPTTEEMLTKGVLPYLDPLPRFEASQPGNILRIFERGGRFRPEVGIPERIEEPGRPRTRLSTRGLGTENRTDPVFIGLQKTRLFDPTLNFLGTNDHPGDYRSSGCTACHVIYANDRSPVHSGPYAVHGNRGTVSNLSPGDPMIPKNQSGHPIEHRFAKGNSIPTSQCIVCHIHPGTTVMNSYIGYMWWDEESDGHLIYPPEQKNPTAEEFANVQFRNPNESAVRSRLADPEFTANLTDLNTATKHNQFADFHGHGWAFRAVFKKDRQGNMLNHKGEILHDVSNPQMRAAVGIVEHLKEPYANAANKTPLQIEEQELVLAHQRDGLPVHLLDIHMEKGMHCVDCHFIQDMHGNGRLQREVRAAIEIRCEDCHGTPTERGTLFTGGPASYTSGPNGRDLEALRTPWGKRRFERVGEQVFQNSMVEPNLRWEVIQVPDTLNPANEHYNVRSHLAKTVRFNKPGENKAEQLTWGGSPDEKCAHSNKKMSCIACHSAWNPSCFGCHLPQKANKKAPNLHNEGDVSRNLVSYNFQTLRDDVYMLAHDGDVTGNRIGPARSSCAIHVGSYNNNRESIYVQQQTISGDGMSGIAFSTNVPHTVRGGSKLAGHPAFTPPNGEVKTCSDCHVSEFNDNNAIMAQLLMQGTNYVNFIGRYCWVAAGEHGFEGVVVTERDEPQAVIGSTLQRLAFPDNYREHLAAERELEHAHEHPGKDISENITHPLRKPEILGLQARGEYLYAACGDGGFRVFDIAFIDDKAFSERITTAPVSPLGQQFYVETCYATAVAAPTTIAPDPTRKRDPANREQDIHAMYGYIFVTDREEGLILVGAGTLLDGDPTNNFLKRELTFNPNGILKGARAITIAGTYAYICCNAGVVVVSLEDPKCPRVTCVLGHNVVECPTAVQIQFRYAFVCDHHGIQVLDVTDLSKPRPVASLELEHAHNIYLARTYAYVAAGKHGLVILNITNPEKPIVDQIYTANGCINDLHDVKLGITYSSEFAYLADGKNGMRVVQLTSPDTPGNMGFSPRPTPQLIATRKLPKEGHALAISKGVDRDRAVDESGNQIAVFGRIGARPLSRDDQHRMYLRGGEVWRVSDNPFSPLYTPSVQMQSIRAQLDRHYGVPAAPAAAAIPRSQMDRSN